MKKQKSDSPIATFFFALYPYSLTFAQKKDDHFILYLEKSLQILSRFTVSANIPLQQKDQFFEVPSKVTSFRIISDKNLSYQWSIYRSNTIGQQSHEEFIETQKIDLTHFWNNFIQNNEPVKLEEVTFKKVRCKYSFLIAVGNQKQILQNIRKYFLTRNNTNQQAKISQFVQSQKSQQFQSKQNSAMLVRSEHQKNESRNQSLEALQSQSHINKIKQANQQPTQQSIPSIVMNKTVSYQILPQENKNEENNLKNDSPQKYLELAKKNDGSVIDSHIYSQLKLHLTLSEVEISNEIEQRIKDTDENMRSPIKQSNGISMISPPSVHDELMAQYRRQKQTRITSSQILNGKGEIIVTPFYYHFKYYLIIIAVVAIFVGLVTLNPQSRTETHSKLVSKARKGKSHGGGGEVHRRKRNK